MVDNQDGKSRIDDEKHVDSSKSKQIQIVVNNKPILVTGAEQTGSQIKKAAVDQDVGIELDFILLAEEGAGKTKSIGDNDKIIIKPEDRFVAIANDDNS